MTLHGFAPAGAKVTTTDGSAGPVRFNSTTRLFSVDVTPGADHNAVVALAAN